MFDCGEVGRLLLTGAPLSRILYVVAVMECSVLAFSLSSTASPSLSHVSL